MFNFNFKVESIRYRYHWYHRHKTSLMKKALAITLLLHVAASLSLHSLSSDLSKVSDFEQFKNKFGKSYRKDEESFRKLTFLRNLEMIKEHNSKPNKDYSMAINQFADLTQEEFEEKYLIKELPAIIKKANFPTTTIKQSRSAVNPDIDW